MPEYTEEQKEKRREANRRSRAKKKLEKMMAEREEDDLEEEEIKVEVPIPDKPSLKERLMNKITPPVGVKSGTKRTKGKRGQQIDKNLLSQMAPMLVASFVATYTRQMVPDPYKVCAPTQDEAMAIIKPYFNILSRYIEITGHASENMIDIIGSIIAASLFGTRSYMSYVAISEAIKRGQDNGTSQAHDKSTGARQHASTHRTSSTERNTEEINGTTGNSVGIGTVAHNGKSDAQNGHSGSRDSDALLVASLFSRDIEGRKQLGLLPI